MVQPQGMVNENSRRRRQSTCVSYACGSFAARKMASPGFNTIVFSMYGAITPTSPGYLRRQQAQQSKGQHPYQPSNTPRTNIPTQHPQQHYRHTARRRLKNMHDNSTARSCTPPPDTPPAPLSQLSCTPPMTTAAPAQLANAPRDLGAGVTGWRAPGAGRWSRLALFVSVALAVSGAEGLVRHPDPSVGFQAWMVLQLLGVIVAAILVAAMASVVGLMLLRALIAPIHDRPSTFVAWSFLRAQTIDDPLPVRIARMVRRQVGAEPLQARPLSGWWLLLLAVEEQYLM